MKASERDFILYLADIVDSMQQVQEYISGLDLQHFKWDRKTVDAVIRNYEIIGEAAKHIPKEIKDNHPEVPWEAMYRMRNRISHEYFGIDYEILWDIATRQLPNNLIQISSILKKEEQKRNK